MKKHIYIFSLLLFWSVPSISNGYDLPDKKLDYLQKCARELIYSQPDTAFKLIEEGLQIAKENRDSSAMALFYFLKGNLYHYVNEELAVSYYFKARELFKNLQDSAGLVYVYRGMGGLTKLYLQQRVDLTRKAILINKLQSDTFNLAASYNNLGAAYFEDLDMLDSAYYYFMKSRLLRECLPQDIKSESNLISNLGSVEFQRGNYKRALFYYKESLEMLPPGNDISLSNIHSNLMLTYFELGKLDSGFYYYNLVREKFPQRPYLEIKAYDVLLYYYKKAGDHKKALYYYEKRDSIKEIQREKNNANALHLLELEYNSRLREEQLSKIKLEQEKDDRLRSLLIAIVFLTILFSGITIYQQQQKARKKRDMILQHKGKLETEQKLLASNLQHSEIKRKYLNDKLNYTNKELTSFATGIVENHNILTDLKEKVSDIARERSVRSMREQLQELNIMLQQIFHNDIQRQEFLKRSRQLNHSLVFHLKTFYPELSEGDINILILLFLKFSSKEICVLYNVESKSVDQRRYRLRRKLNMDTSETFDQFFEQALAKMDIPQSSPVENF